MHEALSLSLELFEEVVGPRDPGHFSDISSSPLTSIHLSCRKYTIMVHILKGENKHQHGNVRDMADKWNREEVGKSR